MLVPVDFSETSKKALLTTVEWAPRLGCEHITALYVAPKPTEYLPLDDWIFGSHRKPEQVESEVRTKSKQALEKLLERHDAAPVEIEARVELGAASAVILEVTQAGTYDLIVMGTRGKNAPRLQRMAGSTAQRVIRASPCPVLSIN